MSVSVLVALDTKSYKILSRIIAQAASWLDVMDLETLRSPAPLATPAISLQDFAAELAISFKVKLQAWSSGTDPGQSVTWTFSRSCRLCGIGRPSTSRVNEGRRASVLPVSRLTPARKSAQIISRQ
jgi:hypothetical protein